MLKLSTLYTCACLGPRAFAMRVKIKKPLKVDYSNCEGSLIIALGSIFYIHLHQSYKSKYPLMTSLQG
jgi:hypothetical protein